MSEGRTVISRRQPTERVIGRRWPAYLVTSAHGVARMIGGEQLRVPYGEWHARMVGSLQTACGRSAVTWPLFWTLEFRNAGQHACPECARVVARHGERDADGRQ